MSRGEGFALSKRSELETRHVRETSLPPGSAWLSVHSPVSRAGGALDRTGRGAVGRGALGCSPYWNPASMHDLQMQMPGKPRTELGSRLCVALLSVASLVHAIALNSCLPVSSLRCPFFHPLTRSYTSPPRAGSLLIQHPQPFNQGLASIPSGRSLAW